MGSSRCRRRLSAPRLLVVALLGMTLVSGCQEQAKERSPSSHDLVVAPITLEPGGAEISYRYIDPESGAVGTAASVEAIPEAARRQVVVYHALHPTPPGWEHVADLTSGLPTSTVPRRGFQLQPRRAPQGGSSGAPGVSGKKRPNVTLFSTAWCGYCTKARNFFKREKIMFSEYDLEKDPSARGKMAEMARKAGVSPDSLQGVPILFINGKAMAGYSEARVRQLLGR